MTPQRPQENLFARNATFVAIVTVTIAVLAAAGLFWQQGTATQKAKGWVDHTYLVRRHVALLYRGLLDAETSQRGYLLTGDPDFLQPYRAAIDDGTGSRVNDPDFEQRRSVKQEMAILRKLTGDNPEQQANLDELGQATRAVQEYLAASVRRRAALPPGPITDLSPFDLEHGRALMDQLRTDVLLVDAEENHLLKQRTEVDNNNEVRNGWLTIIVTLILYIGIVAAIWAYQRSRAKAQTEALLYTQELEKREEELKQQQEELKASNEEIEASNEELEEKTAALEEQNTRIREQSRIIEQANKLVEEKASEVEQASKYKSEFLANMSHELRTPLNSLLILARGFASNEQGNLTPEQVEEARVIHNGGLELLGLINDILDLSKVEAGKISIVPEDVYVDGIIKRLAQSFEPVARERGVEFRIHVDEALPEMIHTDAQRVEQILKNLLSNAFKFTEKGSVTLDVRSATGDADLHKLASSSGVIALSVIDTGIGIDESKLRDIFEAFQQEDGSIDRHYGGTGLGLTIARKFAHILDGEIHVASKKGRGSTFTLYLPITQDGMPAPVSASESTMSARAVAANKTIAKASVRQFIPDDRKSITIGDSGGDKVLLIIEDDRDFAMTLMKTARKRGYKALGAGDGKSGLLLASEYPVTAIILDLRLPDMNGLMVLDQLKHALNTRHIPVHIISGDDSGGTIGPLRKGAVGYLLKPVQEEDIEGAFGRIEGMLNTEVKKVLVVEDDKTTQTAIRSLLKTKNIQIVMAGTGEAALKQVRSEPFDCIILDLSLPDMTGFEWLEAVEKAAGEDGVAPVIVYTARDLTEDENRSLSRYTDSIVIKGASSSERLLDEVTLFLHSVESNLSKDQQATLRMHHDPDRALQKRTVLLVDDDMRNTFALSKLLKKHGLNLVIADNGQMALDKLKENRDIDLVIMDIMMPIMDGYQAMREIRKVPAWASLPIIALTARAMPEEVDKCMEAGANDYMMKPVDIDRLLTLLRVWLFKQEKVA